MIATTLRVTSVMLAAALAVPAQGESKPPAPAKATKAAARSPKGRPKDDATTAKDPAIVALDKFSKAQANTARAEWKTSLPAPPLQKFDGKRDYRWHVETDQGLLVIRLLPADAPMHVTSTIYLARLGFYDGLRFPRIVKGFMAQGGSPSNTQSGNAGYQMDGELASGRKHDGPGILSAAHAGPGTDGSQFFLTFVATPHLDGKHTVYGVTIDGHDTLKAIEACADQQGGDQPREPVTIVRSWITVVPAAAPAAPAKDAPGR